MLDLFDLAVAKAINGDSGGGGSATLLNNKDISANGTYKASDDSADGYKKVTVSVANSYAAADEGKVVSNGALVSQTAHATVTQNGTVDTTTNNSVEVAVPAPSGTKQISITQNGTTTENVADYASAEISVNVSGGGSTPGVAYEKHDVDFTLAASTSYDTILNQYVDEAAFWAIYPTDADNTNTNTIATGLWWQSPNSTAPSLITGITTATGVALSTLYYFTVNDQSYNATRTRANCINKPAGNYRLTFYGVAK